MTDEEMKSAKELAEHSLNNLPRHIVIEDLHGKSYIAGFIAAVAASQNALKTIVLNKTSWKYCKNELPTETGRYYVAQVNRNGNKEVTTRKFFKRTGKWADGKWATAENVYAWMSYEPPMMEIKDET